MPRDWKRVMARFKAGNILNEKDADPIIMICQLLHKLEVCEYVGSIMHRRNHELNKVFLLRDRK